mmetsp:Transcript_728/g.974  ORF Transcript_728/g.974 Transcript_728/m.974 type:complete len:192 (-) Transcript_728:239-814(-)
MVLVIYRLSLLLKFRILKRNLLILIIRLTKKEYRDAQWITPAIILSNDFHPAYQQAVRDLMAFRAYRKLSYLTKNPLTPAFLIASAARNLLAWNDLAPPTLNDQYVIYDEQNEQYIFKEQNNASNSKAYSIQQRPLKPLPILAARDLDPSRILSKKYLIPAIRLFLDAFTGPLVGAFIGIALYRRSLLSRA